MTDFTIAQTNQRWPFDFIGNKRDLSFADAGVNDLKAAVDLQSNDYIRVDPIGIGYPRMRDPVPTVNGFAMPFRSGPFHLGISRNNLHQYLTPGMLRTMRYRYRYRYR